MAGSRYCSLTILRPPDTSKFWSKSRCLPRGRCSILGGDAKVPYTRGWTRFIPERVPGDGETSVPGRHMTARGNDIGRGQEKYLTPPFVHYAQTPFSLLLDWDSSTRIESSGKTILQTNLFSKMTLFCYGFLFQYIIILVSHRRIQPRPPLNQKAITRSEE